MRQVKLEDIFIVSSKKMMSDYTYEIEFESTLEQKEKRDEIEIRGIKTEKEVDCHFSFLIMNRKIFFAYIKNKVIFPVSICVSWFMPCKFTFNTQNDVGQIYIYVD